jgi:hypothetical protein
MSIETATNQNLAKLKSKVRHSAKKNSILLGVYLQGHNIRQSLKHIDSDRCSSPKPYSLLLKNKMNIKSISSSTSIPGINF